MSDPISQIASAISAASSFCTEIKKTRHVGHSHTQLDLLEASLAAADSLPLPPPMTFSSAATAELESYVEQMEEINARLEHIAHPDRKKHASKHHHHHHEHKEMEDPHFGELR